MLVSSCAADTSNTCKDETMKESYFSMEAFAEDNPHRVRRPMSDLKLIGRDLDEIEARAASRPPASRSVRRAAKTESLSALSFAAQAGDVEARRKLRQRSGLK